MSTTLTNARPAADRLAEIDFDATMLRLKLTDPEEGEPWSKDKLDLAEQEYRRYLALCLAYPEKPIVPCGLVDEFWHAHILDTRAYREDSQRIFGFFYDHYPYFGINGPDDAANLRIAYDETLALYEQNFGELTEGAWISTAAGKCRTKCRPMKCK